MAHDINLLPTELKTGKDALKVSRALKRAAAILGGIFVVATLIVGGILFFLYQSLSSSRQNEEQLKNQVQSLEATEQKLVLVKDRIQKAQNVLSLRDEFVAIKRYDALIAALPPNATLTEMELDAAVSTLTIVARDSDDLSAIMKLLTSADYQRVELESLTFNVYSGYEVVVSIN